MRVASNTSLDRTEPALVCHACPKAVALPHDIPPAVAAAALAALGSGWQLARATNTSTMHAERLQHQPHNLLTALSGTNGTAAVMGTKQSNS